MPAKKRQLEMFSVRVEALGATAAICEWTNKSGLVGYTYQGTIYRWHVPGAKKSPAGIQETPEAYMLGNVILACMLALVELQCQQAGIERVEKRGNGHG